MLVWSTVEASCPMCQTRLRVRQVGGGMAAGQDTDLLVRMQGRHVIQAEIHTCKHCRFSGYDHDFVSRLVSGHMVNRFFEEVAGQLADEPGAKPSATSGDEEKPRSKTKRGGSRRTSLGSLSQTPLPHVQYYWASLAAPALGLTPVETGLRWVRAYWCLRLPPSNNLPEKRRQELQKYFLREGISRLRQGLRHEKSSSLVYLIGELCRRNSYFNLSRRYFERFLEREKGALYLRQASNKLLAAAIQQNSHPKTMEEVLYDEAKDSMRKSEGRD